MKKITAIVIGGGNRAKCYCEYAKLSPEKLEIVGVAEPNENNRNYFRDTFGIKDENVFCDWKEILKMPKMADVAFICTQDQMHYEPAMKALDLGYNLLLEKPVAVSALFKSQSKTSSRDFTLCKSTVPSVILQMWFPSFVPHSIFPSSASPNFKIRFC